MATKKKEKLPKLEYKFEIVGSDGSIIESVKSLNDGLASGEGYLDEGDDIIYIYELVPVAKIERVNAKVTML